MKHSGTFMEGFKNMGVFKHPSAILIGNLQRAGYRFVGEGIKKPSKWRRIEVLIIYSE